MSWSITATGTPSELLQQLRARRAQLTGESLAEYSEAEVHLRGLLQQTFGPADQPAARLTLDASGHGTSQGGRPVRRQCIVSIRSATPDAAP